MLGPAIKLFRQGKTELARKALESHLANSPNDPDALNLLAIVLAQMGNNEQAETLFSKSVRVAGAIPEHLRNYALFLHRCGRFEEAAQQFEQALELAPNSVAYLADLAKVFYSQRRLDLAEAQMQKAIELAPESAELHFQMGVILHEQPNLHEARQHLEKACRLQPNNPHCWSHLGGVLVKQGLKNQAEPVFRNALQLDPNSIDSLSNLGNILLMKMLYEEAEQVYQRALQLDKQNARNWFNVGNVLQHQYKLEAAEHHALRCLQIEADYAEARNVLGGIYLATGRVDQACQEFKSSAESERKSTVYSNYLYAMHFLDPAQPELELDAHRAYEKHYSLAEKLTPVHQFDQQRPLRIGFVSPDFRRHSVAFFIEPVFDHLVADSVAIHCYHISAAIDEVTDRLRNKVQHWRQADNQTDEELARAILDDRIDVLVDLAGHTGKNRLPVFTARPAPVQMSYLGYSGSTGLTEMDYLITDRLANPPDSQRYCTERLTYLPDTYFCYRPPRESPAVAALPCEKSSTVTFGSFSNRAKINSSVLDAWREILDKVAGAKLLLKNLSLTDPRVRQEIMQYFASHGISAERIQLVEPKQTTGQHLGIYSAVDIALDTFPYNGATTTCEALWMGVPVVSLCGQSHVSRMGLSILSAVGLGELVANSREEYINTSIRLAGSIPALRQLRRTMRERLTASPLMDEARHAHAFESICRDACAGISNQ